ncbi:hypothetical protein BJ875DRAFT_137087 [Amylocarpus encephaloides]|uniref:Uncharacterized protein n=1 Tax=Amylocarpus encephaloides TaxID=45428 RepID=A0A9P7YQX7_9HELO|nr:hypothetical protein BJ875DRAFT_137087 [Amylocarpus encephaloides]
MSGSYIPILTNIYIYAGAACWGGDRRVRSWEHEVANKQMQPKARTMLLLLGFLCLQVLYTSSWLSKTTDAFQDETRRAPLASGERPTLGVLEYNGESRALSYPRSNMSLGSAPKVSQFSRLSLDRQNNQRVVCGDVIFLPSHSLHVEGTEFPPWK